MDTRGNTESQTTNPPLWHESLAGLDWLALRFSPVFRGTGVARGDGSAVVVIPGCFASDSSLVEMHAWLARVGYQPYFSGIGINARCPAVSVEMIVDTVDRAFEETGRPVTLIGHSLGGLLARGAAIRRAGKVARVITLGSPVNGLSAHPLVMGLAEMFHGDCDGGCVPALQQPLPDSVEETNVFTRCDGVVDWRTCFREDGEAVEVSGTHVGLVVNARAYEAIARTLSGTRARTLRWEPRTRHSLQQAA